MKYSSTEEKLNIATHALGVLLSVPATYFLIARSESRLALCGSIIFGLSLFLLYLASTTYHATQEESKRQRLRVFDHSAIFILIAGTYTPICLVSLWHSWGPALLIVIWSIAVVGVILKLFYTGRYDRASTILYVAMGWIALIAVKPLLDSLTAPALLWLLAGGVWYTVGAILYSLRKLPFNHAIFHVFVLGGSASHFVMIYQHVI